MYIRRQKNKQEKRTSEEKKSIEKKRKNRINCDKIQIHYNVTNDFLRYQFVFPTHSLNYCTRLQHSQPEIDKKRKELKRSQN